MHLNIKQIHRANLFHMFLKKQDVEYFDLANIWKCESCNGTGLEGYGKLKSGGGYHWDAKSYCDKCDGIGYCGLMGGNQISMIDYICRTCNGHGCSECKYQGIVDWISHSMGR